MKRKFTEIRIGKHHIHYAWVVLFACCMFFGASMGIYSNCSGLYTAGMLGEMGWSLTLITVFGAAWNLLQSALFDLSGSYTTTFILYTVASGIAAVLTVRLFAAEKTGLK